SSSLLSTSWSHTLHSLLFHCSLVRPPPPSTLFPYTTLFRSPPDDPRPGENRRPQPGTDAAKHARRRRRNPRAMIPNPRGKTSPRSEEHTSELQSRFDLVCRLLLEKKKKRNTGRSNAESHETS